jgi:hypothetical protein
MNKGARLHAASSLPAGGKVEVLAIDAQERERLLCVGGIPRRD